MIQTTSGNRETRAINAESVKEQIFGRIAFSSENKAIVDVLKQLLDDIDRLPTIETLDGKKMRKTLYPRIMVKDNCRKGAKPLRVGGNSHHQLQVRHGNNCSGISFINLQCYASTDFADEGYTFVGEKVHSPWGDDTEVVPFDTVWVEEEEK